MVFHLSVPTAAPTSGSKTDQHFSDGLNRSPVADGAGGAQGGVEIGIGELGFGHPVGQQKIDLAASDEQAVTWGSSRIERQDFPFIRLAGEKSYV
jgi:hypothetical protein